MWRIQRELRRVRSKRGAAGEWASEGSLNGLFYLVDSVDADGNPTRYQVDLRDGAKNKWT